MKRFLFAFLAAFVFIFFWGWLYNGVLLKDVYTQTSSLWRPQSETMSLFHWIILGQATLVLAFVMIYASGLPPAVSPPESGLESCWRSWR